MQLGKTKGGKKKVELYFSVLETGKTRSLTLGVNILGLGPGRLFHTVNGHCEKDG